MVTINSRSSQKSTFFLLSATPIIYSLRWFRDKIKRTALVKFEIISDQNFAFEKIWKSDIATTDINENTFI